MPGRDGTGPFGTGPVGRRLGPCGGVVDDPYYGRQFGMGMANRWGRRFGGWAPRWGRGVITSDEEKQILQDQQSWLKNQLDEITRRMEQLDKPNE